ncbi:hypothetical protein [Selenomonas sp. AE3005]|jgi:hypothetical protein|uniref:hypothetical protein n=1 Tax=Selenomonas sp. AE3005 TaxID=1485543 RepID=UPI0025ED52DD|nr:hypothetical protein [Selenomonas sp. AE3005]
MAMNMWGNNGYTGNQPQQPTPPNSMITFINDDSIAANYPVAPGTTVALINANDPNDGKMFIKSTEPNGLPNPMRIFALQEITPQKQNPDSVSRQEFDALTKQLQSMQQLLINLQQPQEAPTKGGKSK